MGAIFAWIQQHGFSAVQTVGIVGSLLLTLVALRREGRARRATDYLTLTSLHHELWAELHRRPELARIIQPVVDLVAEPLSIPEEQFLMLVINHFHVGWRLFCEGGLLSLNVLAADARAFFSLPLPHLVWERSKQPRDPRFVRFIERALAGGA